MILKLLIIDDEPIILEGLQKVINWGKIGYKVIGTAPNGVVGLQKIKVLKPDVVLTDICMHQMDGLELIKRTKEFDKNIEFVMLSAYSDFEYAQTACNLGAYSYVLKPFEEKEIAELMSSLREKIINERNIQRNYLKMDNIIKEHKPQLEKSFLKKLLLSNLEQEKIEKGKVEFDLNLTDNDDYLVVIARIDEVEQSTWNDNDNEMCLFVIENIIQEQFEKYFNIMNTYINDENVTFLILCNEKNKEHKDKIDNILNKCIKYIKAYMNISVSIAKSSFHKGYEGIKKSYDEANNAMEISYILGVNQLFDKSQNNFEIKIINKYPIKIEYQIIDSVLRKDINRFKENLDEFIEYFKKEDCCYAYISICLQNLMISIIKSYMEFDNDVYEKYSEMVVYLSNIYKSSIETMKEKIIYYINDLIQSTNVNDKMQNFSNDIIERSLRYINENITTPDLSIKDVAQEVYLNSMYFGRVFKNDIGKTFNQYVTEIRLEMAKNILKDNNLMVSDVALKVGIDNLSYFNVLFKKYTGITPTQYKNRMREKV